MSESTLQAETRGPRRRLPALTLVSPGDVPPRFDWSYFFPRLAEGSKEGAPPPRIEVEIGVGKGGFLQQAALANPATNYLGIDYAGKFFRIAARRLARDGAENVALFYGTFEPLFAEMPPASVDAIRIYFPDPWHKKRHQKRRMLRQDSLHWFYHALRPGGRLLLRTDVPDYYEAMLEELAEVEAGFAVEERLIYHELPRPNWYPTNYERRFLADGLTCHAIEARKKAPSA